MLVRKKRWFCGGTISETEVVHKKRWFCGGTPSEPGSSAKKGGFVDEIEVVSEGAGGTVKEKRTPLKYVGL